MRILLVSDLHYGLPQLDWVVEAAADFDLVVVAGDSLDIASVVPLDAQSAVIDRYLTLLDEATTVVVCSGNHDLTGPDANGEQSALWLAGPRDAGITTDGGSLLVDDTLVTVCPWWDGPLGREAVVAQLSADAARRPARWLWVYHWPPVGSPTCWTGQKSYGDTDLGGWIDEFAPDLVLAGHVHQSPFTEGGSWVDRIATTWVLNAGHQIGRVPARIELDLDAGTARWVSIMGVEEVDLTSATVPARTVF
jgi:Icc-related predicted phosphoesterase